MADEAELVGWAERALGHRFRQPELLVEALTHPTYAYEVGGPSNQRLEFLGDAVLSLVISRYLYERYPDWPEGTLSRVRAALVSAPTLAASARALGIGQVLRLGKGEERMGGRDRESNLADALEALVAAVYVDGGLEAAAGLVLAQLAPQVEAARTGRLHPNHKAQLLEWAQRRTGRPPHYQVVAEEGPTHARRFRVRVFVGGEAAGEGEGSSKRAAEQEAAREALLRLRGRADGTEPRSDEHL